MIGKLRVAELPRRLEWDSLDLGVRAYNALTRRRGLPRPASLSGWPLAELMKVKAFGVTSLLDLLTSLEDATGLSSVVAGVGDATTRVTTAGSEPDRRRADPGVVIDDVLRRLPVFLDSRLRGIPEGLRWVDVAIGVRTYRSLVISRAIPRPAVLNGMPLGDLMRRGGLGRESFRDLLTALEKATGCSFAARGGAALELAARERRPAVQLGVQTDSLVSAEEKRRSLDLAVSLMRLEQVLGPDVIGAKDPRFGPQLRIVAPGCADSSELLATLSATIGQGGRGHGTSLKALRTLCGDLTASRKLGLLAELEGIVRSISKDAHAKIIVRFWGWDGRGGTTLQQVGDEYGLSRERVRQITDRAKEQLEARGLIFAPAAARALDITQGIVPATTATVIAALAGEGVVPLDSDLAFLANLGGFLGRPTAFRLDRGYGTFVSTRAGEELVDKVHRQASRLAKGHGAACVEDVCDALRAEGTSPPGSEGVSRLLRMRADLVWLDDEHWWFCKRQMEGNVLLKRVHKVVAVAGRVRVGELRGGVTRDYYLKLKGSVPSRAILLRLCGHDPTIEVQDEIVAERHGAALEGDLSPPERIFWRVLLESGPVMARPQLERGCLTAGLSRSSFLSTLTYSPILIRYAPQVYGLRGVAIPPGAIESLELPRVIRKGRLLLDSGWAGEGRVRLVYKLSEGSVSNGIVTIPASFTRFLQGDYRLMRLGHPVGILRCRGSQGWGLGPLFRRMSAEAGDSLTLEVDLQTSEAQVSVTAEGSEGVDDGGISARG